MRTSIRFPRAGQGFSLIEVLLAVAVLSFGLLALTALQVNMIRSSAEAKAQSTAMSLAQERLEELKGFDDLDTYRDMTSNTSGVAVSIGGVAYTRRWYVQRFSYFDNTADGVRNGTMQTDASMSWSSAGCTATLDSSSILTASDTTLNAANYWPNVGDFKRITVTVSWTGADGVAQCVVLGDVVASISPSDSSRALSSPNTKSRKPQVLITNPESEAGVIPIAIGDGSDTAATNPRPEVAGNNNNQQQTETRFDVLTYAGLNSTEALAQARVETRIVGCRCDYANAPTDTAARGLRPTYWNGLRYAEPEDTDYVPPAGEANLSNQEVQSALCDTCCRDHHDPVGVTGAKFDPLRGTHEHSLLDSDDGTLTPTSTGEYTEVCRMIRVGGIFRVAADMYNESYTLVETLSDDSSTEYAPADDASDNYENYVLDFLDYRVVSNNDSDTYNTALDSGVIATLQTDHEINEPATVNLTTSSDNQYLHARGLYIDYLEPEAIDQIEQAKASCAGDVAACVLKYTPFTSINLTELSFYSPLNGPTIAVEFQDFLNAEEADQPPISGNVTPYNAVANATATATASSLASNSGLGPYRYAIDGDEGAALTDTQDFSYQGSNQSNGGSFTVTLGGTLTFGAAATSWPQVQNPDGDPNINCSATGSPNPYSCDIAIAGADTVVISKYNSSAQKKGNTFSPALSITCTNSNGVGTTTTTLANNDYVTVCSDYEIASTSVANLGITYTSAGLIGETATIDFGTIADGSAITVTFSGPTSTYAYTCQCNNNNCSNRTVTPGTCP